jgi:signal transduction histidine kinase
VKADPAMLQQVLVSLVANAREAMPQGGHMTLQTAQVSIGESSLPAEAEISPGSYVQLTIIDTGRGIAPEVLPRLFEPFYTTKASGMRLGLGLAIAYNVVQQHYGWIQVTSRVGQGSTFDVFLPATPEPRQVIPSSLMKWTDSLPAELKLSMAPPLLSSTADGVDVLRRS